jgi:hypothetical protein
MTKMWIVTGLSGLALASVLAAGALAQDTGRRAPQRQQLHARAGQVRQFVRALDLSRAQKEQALSVAHAAQPIVRELREQIRAERGQGRAHVKELVRNAFLRLQPQVRALIGTFTPEQRARIEALAQRHGRTLDEARLERGLAFLLSRPGAAARIQAHLDR